MRKLATIEKISNILPHPNADAIEIALVRGWQCVVKKDEFKAGDLAIYFEIDSWIPNDIAPFLSKDHEPRVYNGIKGERLRTVKLRGKLSQGLLLPLSILDMYLIRSAQEVQCVGKRIWLEKWQSWAQCIVPLEEGADLTEFLDIQKYDPPVPSHLAGNARGNFPSFIRKTDQERVQNCWNDVKFLNNHQHGGIEWGFEEKLDGSSCTIYTKFNRDVADGYYELGVCSRKLDLKLEDNEGNTFISVAKRDGYLDALPKLNLSIAIQAELCGPGIQGNKLNLVLPELFVFDIWFVDHQRYATRDERNHILSQLRDLGVQVNEVPFLGITHLPDTLEECLAMAEGKSKINPKAEREGIVFKSVNVIEGEVPSFKSISNKFLLKNE